MNYRTFICRDCGVSTTATVDDSAERCLICGCIAEIKDDTTRDEARVALYGPEEMWHWKSVGCYRDEAKPERPCDRCGKPYRGPAVYCSLDCALADAGTTP